MASPKPAHVSPPAPMEGVTSSAPQQASSEPQDTPAVSLPTVAASNTPTPGDVPQPPPPLSKNALKRMRKDKEWADGLEDRRRQRKEKRQDRRVRKREQRAALVAQGLDPSVLTPKKPTSINVPISLIFDCDFEEYMLDKELISLGSQITRSYSENKNATYRTHLWVSGWKGKLAARFRDVLDDMQKNWKGTEFIEGDLLECVEKAREKMQTRGGTVITPLQKSLEEKVPWVRDEKDPFPITGLEPEPREEYKDVVYLSSDSPYTLERLEPNTSYVIGGLVDKNREKGLCYKRARAMGIRTARLPIGEYMEMQSRSVLATNHVVEIMLKWLQYENWGDAFLSVIPKRKGGQLRRQDGASGEGEEYEGAEEEEYELEEGGAEEVANAEGSTEEKKAPEAVAEVENAAAKP
ncbi:tRNA (guanine(9)-N(1))-methyltransferase [Neonectria magnoliae]|uniref:tRNA (guanine(9)-N1)-methyltransferase n=1 Tax=Neonectria magnoliae TaxID=2732573 RepID=A0ABR1I7A7_9HYPO